MNRRRVSIITALTALIFLGVSIFLYVMYGHHRVSRIFYYPEDRTMIITGEEHRIPRQDHIEANVETYIDEWLLGPLNLQNNALFPRGTKLSAIFLRENRLFLDFSADILFRGDEATLSIGEIRDTLQKGIFFNFPGIEEVYISIEGEPLPPSTETE